jgi:tetratricopeptide (TPR) repeat protein
MAKHRSQPKSKARQSLARRKPAQRPAPQSQATQSIEASRVAPPATSSQPPPIQRRSTYFEAVAIYERGLAALQRHDFLTSSELFESVLRLYPEERELLERVRLYLNVCKRHVTPREDAPQTPEERLYAATLAFNGGRYDEAILHLRLVRDEDPDNDHALYMLAVAHAQRAEHAEAIAHLERAIALNPENKALARRDPDLEVLRGSDAFRTTLESSSMTSADRGIRKPLRPKLAR